MELTCPQCAAALSIPDESAGRQARCPNCSAVFDTPAASGNSTSRPAATPPPAAPIDPGNPYASTYQEAPERSSNWSPRQISYEEVFSKSWTIFKNQWLMTCLAVLIVMAVNMLISFVQNILMQVLAVADIEPVVIILTQIILTILGQVIQVWLGIGQTMVIFDIARGREVNLAKVFGGGHLLGKVILAFILFWLALMAIAAVLVGIPVGVGFAVTQEPNGAAIGAFIGALIAIVPFVIVSLMFSQFQMLIIDRDLTAVESLKVSREITEGNKLTLFVIGILLMVVWMAAVILGLLALCVGIIPAIIGATGFSVLVMVVSYLCMTGQAVAIQPTYVTEAPATT